MRPLPDLSVLNDDDMEEKARDEAGIKATPNKKQSEEERLRLVRNKQEIIQMQQQ